MKPVVELENVSVVYNEGLDNEVVAVRNISLQIFPGEYIVFFGQSGSGKSTLLYTIAGLEAATKGRVLVAGSDLVSSSAADMIRYHRSTIGMVFQAFYLVSHLTVADNVALPFMLSGIMPIEYKKRAQFLIDRFGLTNVANRKPSEMSGGQQQRTAIARALMHDPQIVLADEPVGNLDTKNAEIVLELLAQINKEEKRTIIQVTHNPKDISYADRVFYLKDGQIEKVVVNTKKRGVEEKTPHSELAQLALVYPHLSNTELWAKIVVHRVLHEYDRDTEEKIESIVSKFIVGDIPKTDLVHWLDDDKEGVGLNAQKARHLAGDIARLVSEIEKVNAAAEAAHQEKGRPHGVESLQTHLLRLYHGHLSAEQAVRFKQVLSECLEKNLAGEECFSRLDTSYHKGGVGLDARTARLFAKEIDMMLGNHS